MLLYKSNQNEMKGKTMEAITKDLITNAYVSVPVDEVPENITVEGSIAVSVPTIGVKFEVWYENTEENSEGLISDISSSYCAVHDTFDEALKEAISISKSMAHEGYTFNVALAVGYTYPDGSSTTSATVIADVMTNGQLKLDREFIKNNADTIIECFE